MAAAVRARLYARYGVSVTQTVAITTFQGITSSAGFAAIVGFACLTGFGGTAAVILGVATIGGIAAYLAVCALHHQTFHVWGYTFSLPRLPDALIQIGLGLLDNGLAIAILWVLLPQGSIGYPSFGADYVIAYVGGALSGAPGGAGAFDGALVKLLPTMDHASLGAALLGFRLIFNILPLVGAAALYAIDVFGERLRRPRNWPSNENPGKALPLRGIDFRAPR